MKPISPLDITSFLMPIIVTLVDDLVLLLALGRFVHGTSLLAIKNLDFVRIGIILMEPFESDNVPGYIVDIIVEVSFVAYRSRN